MPTGRSQFVGPSRLLVVIHGDIRRHIEGDGHERLPRAESESRVDLTKRNGRQQQTLIPKPDLSPIWTPITLKHGLMVDEPADSLCGHMKCVNGDERVMRGASVSCTLSISTCLLSHSS